MSRKGKPQKRQEVKDKVNEKEKRGTSTNDLPINLMKTEEISPTSPALLAWCSSENNKINIVGLKTKQLVAHFDGVKLKRVNVTTHEEYKSSAAHVKEIANTGLLVSVHHCWDTSANLEVFDVSQKERVRKIFSFEEVSGVTGYGDIAYNPQRRILGAISVRGKIAYHLYSFATSKTGNNIKLIRKSRWHSPYIESDDPHITSLDFNPNGETAGTVDPDGRCVISDVNTDNCRVHVKMGSDHDQWARCRWSTNTDESLLFIKYDNRYLNIVDAEKKALILKSPFEIETWMWTLWIDVCRSNGNLLASGGWDSVIKIFDKRESNIVQTLDGIHSRLFCVKWSPSGDMLASASFDKTVALLDFKTGKKLYSGQTSGGEYARSVCFI